MKRLAYIDWLRGLACVLMFQDHCYGSWLAAQWDGTKFVRGSQLLGTLPAPLFLFLAGVSVGLMTQKLREKGSASRLIARQTILRGLEIFALGLLFRLQEYALGFKWVPWTDLLRVDILNVLGLSIAALGILCWLAAGPASPAVSGDPTPVEVSRRRSLYAALTTAAAIALLTPPLWSAWRPRFLPWPLESYINGVHNLNEPQRWLFPLFPWCAFAFLGLAAGFSLFSEMARKNESRFFVRMAALGAGAVVLALVFDALPVRIYARQDFWHSDPDFFFLRCGVLLILMSLAYAWCKQGWGQKGFSPIIQLGNTSLLVYWVHIELVYGVFSILPKQQCTIARATLGLSVIYLSMLALSLWRTEAKTEKEKVRASEPLTPAMPAPAAG